MKSIDLHGIRHENVRRELDNFFWYIIKNNITQFEIITGFSEQMKKIVYEVCEEYGFKAKESLINGGCLIVNN